MYSKRICYKLPKTNLMTLSCLMITLDPFNRERVSKSDNCLPVVVAVVVVVVAVQVHISGKAKRSFASGGLQVLVCCYICYLTHWLTDR